jgi:phospholipid/cholesterol/gamma-HCH transport system ATP-binding protein
MHPLNAPSGSIAESAAAGAETAVEFSHVSLGFDGKTILRDISFTVQRGETRIILGPAGCGKSLLLKLTNGLITPDSGSVRLLGHDLSSLEEDDLYALRAQVGMVFQEGALFDSLTVRENVAYRLREENYAEEFIEAKVREVLQFVEMEHAIDQLPSQISGGMRRRVAIARAIITQPALLLYDSPTGGLDPITSTTIIELIVKERDVYGGTSLLVTHRLQDAFTLATHGFNPSTCQMERILNHGLAPSTKCLVLNNAQIVFDGGLEELVHSNDPFLQSFLA